jgi:hypothetical protein
MRRRLLLAFLILVAACVPGSAPAALSPTASPIPTTAPTTAALPTSDADPAPTRISLASERVATLDTVLHQVERLRGIEARQPIVPVAASSAELGPLARAAFAADWPPASLENQLRLFQFLGLAPASVNVEVLMAAAGAGAILSAPDGGLTLAAGALSDDDLVRGACAYDRALLMQAFPETVPALQAEACQDDLDACLASRALVEGDAALLAEQWRRTFGGKASPPLELPAACGAALPRTDLDAVGLADLLSFPVEQGLAFARALYLKGGWAAIDQAHASPPVSSEQILHPDRYPKDTPRALELVDLAASLGAGWTTLDSDSLGEWQTLLALQAFLEPDQAALAAGGWDGDQYALLREPGQGLTAWVLLTRWDTVRDAHEFSGAFRIYGENRFGPSKRIGSSLSWTIPQGVIVLDVGNDQTLWIQAPDAQMADALRTATLFPLR